jgi:hypothetical protein
MNMTSAIDRFKMLLANALERVCVLEEELEKAQEQIAKAERFARDQVRDQAVKEEIKE